METTAINTVVKMMEPLPEAMQKQVVEHLREYIADLQDEADWDELFKRTEQQLVAHMRRLRQEVKSSRRRPL